jgi:hypothetical protein
VFFVVLYPTVEPDRVAGIGLTLTRTRFARAGWRLAAGSLVLIGLIGFLPLGRALSLPLENRFRRRPASSHAGDPGGKESGVLHWRRAVPVVTGRGRVHPAAGAG